jgi:hypothetical protein
LKKPSINSIYIILNLLYIIPGIFCALLYFNSFYQIFKFYDLPRILESVIAIIIGIPYLLFYIMSLTFTILIHPLVQIIIFYFDWKKKNIIKKNIIIVFIISLIIAFIYLYLIWGKGLILTV